MDYVKAFLVGGIICALVQILMEKTKLMPGRIMVLLVVSGAILGCIGLYQPFVEWAGDVYKRQVGNIRLRFGKFWGKLIKVRETDWKDG